LGGDENVDHVMPNTGSNTEMQILGAFLLDYVGNAIRMGRLVEYVDILVGRDGSIKWCGRKKKQL
jgi:hypothetical protein